MSDYKRWTERKIDLDKLSDKAKSRISDTYLDYAKMNNVLWELENKIEQGLMVELPCKVGDKFYTIDTLYCEYREREISGFTIENGELILIDRYFNSYKVSEVCFSKDKAERKLKYLKREVWKY